MARGDLFASDNIQRLPVRTWIASAISTPNGIAFLTKAGEIGRRHYIVALSGSYNPHAAAGAERNLGLTFNLTTVARWSINSVIHVPFPVPLECPEELGGGEGAVKLQLGEGGGGITAQVTLVGFTL